MHQRQDHQPVVITDIRGDDPSVEYREVPSHIGYAVGTDGSVWSRRSQGRRVELSNTWRRLNGNPCHEYLTVVLDRKRYPIHHLVLIAFVAPRPPGMICCHADDNPQNNRLENLRWGTYRENGADHKRNKRRNRTPRKGAKLTVESVLLIRKLARLGWPQADIAAMFGVNRPTISAIEGRTAWGWLDD